jgi:hypothetical protein
MDNLFHDTADDAESSGEGRDPSIEALVDAFRDAVGETRPASSSLPDEETERPSTGPTPIPSPQSPADILNETIAAFRKAERRAEEKGTRYGGPKSESPSQPEPSFQPEPRDRPEPSESDARFPREELPSEEEGVEASETDEEEEDEPFEDFGPAFREALSAKGTGEPLGSENVFGDANGNGGVGAGESEEDQAEPLARRGDGLPASEKLETSVGTASSGTSSPASDNSPSFPSRPDASFLWVTAQPTDHSAAISVNRLGETRAKNANAFLLSGRGKKPHELLKRIRGHSAMGVYLKPVFWRRTEGTRSPVAPHVDGEWAGEEREVFSALRGQASSINQQINDLLETGGEGGGGVELRVLRFMATRNHEFTPQRTVENADGFVYPKLSPLLERDSQSGGDELSQVLGSLEDRRLLNGEFVLNQHACRNCGCAFLNFEEMCPHCGATDIDTDDLVHHFRCAFTGALDEYKEEEGQLVCPKCDRSLKQIGVDYDKPSVVHTCNRCHEQFQDPEVQSTCYRCEHVNPPDRQVERQIKEYEVTALGEETAIYGLSDSLLSILERESRVLDYATFQLIVDSEAARIERYQRSTSSLLLVRVTGLKELRMELGERSQEVIEEIATAFDNTLRSSDYLSSRDESLYMFLLTETDQSGARRAGERLENNIEGVLSQNLQRPPQLDIAVQPVHPDIALDNLSEQFLARHSREPAVANGR